MLTQQSSHYRVRNAFAILIAGWILLFAFDAQLGLPNQAMLLVLLTAITAVWLPPLVSLAASALGVLAFNVAFIPPRGTLHVDLNEHVALLVTTLSVSVIVAVVVGRMRQHAHQAQVHARRADEQRDLAEQLRADDDVDALCRAFMASVGTAHGVLTLGGCRVGAMSATELSGLGLAASSNQPMGRGTGRYDELDAWLLPIKGARGALGAVLFRAPQDQLQHAMTLCAVLCTALERATARQHAADARAAAEGQAVRSTLLAAIAHDHRTPLATIMGAASALREQWERLPASQRDAYIDTVIGEAGQLARLTDNTLQLARLDSGAVDLQRDWESVEELVGTVVHRARQRAPGIALQTDVASGLPLVSCDAVLLVQLLDNLIDNAVKYAGPAPAILVQASVEGNAMLLSVQDRGSGLPQALLAAPIRPFQRGAESVRGAGLGLAVCAAVATVHGGRLDLRQREGGGCLVQLALPLATAKGAP